MKGIKGDGAISISRCEPANSANPVSISYSSNAYDLSMISGLRKNSKTCNPFERGKIFPRHGHCATQSGDKFYMQSNNLIKNIRNIGFALSLLVGFVLISGVNVQAQYRDQNNRQDRNDDRYDNNGGRMYQMAVQNGYQDGLKQGLKDARSNRNSNGQGNSSYRSAGRGYQSRRGSRSAFQGAYREGFMRGYQEAFQRYQENNRNRNRGRNHRNDDHRRDN